MSERLKNWYEMHDVRRRRLENAVWIPLRAKQVLARKGETSKPGFLEEFFGVGSLAIPLGSRSLAAALSWDEIGLVHEPSSYFDEDRYIPADVYLLGREPRTAGIHLVLTQPARAGLESQWHLNQDLVIALGLYREADHWTSPSDGFVEVARLRRDDEQGPNLLEIRSEYLKDYLCAREMALLVASYRSRVTVTERSISEWSSEAAVEESPDERWERRATALDEAGFPAGERWTVFQIGRTDVDYQSEVPKISVPAGGTAQTAVHHSKRGEPSAVRIEGELWRREWVEPGSISARVRGDKGISSIRFITKGDGTSQEAEALKAGGQWLWFTPQVIPAIASRRGGSLSWISQDVGRVSATGGYGVTFGINHLGLVNVYAKDVALLPVWQQKLWSGFNISPDGGVGDELLACQAEGLFLETVAPEAKLGETIEELDRVACEILGFPVLLKNGATRASILPRINRFRSLDLPGLCSLAKDVSRVIGDSLDASALQLVVPPPPKVQWRSLKSLQQVLAKAVNQSRAQAIMAPLFGAYELRIADAHIESGDLAESLRKCRIDAQRPYVHQGLQLLSSCLTALREAIGVLSTLPSG